MPMAHNEAQQKADEDAIAAGKCPECLADLTDKDVRNHLEMEFPHWQEPAQANTDYGRRARLLDLLAQDRESKKSQGGAH